MQELPKCEEMTKFSIPKAIAGDTCYEGQKAVDTRAA